MTAAHASISLLHYFKSAISFLIRSREKSALFEFSGHKANQQRKPYPSVFVHRVCLWNFTEPEILSMQVIFLETLFALLNFLESTVVLPEASSYQPHRFIFFATVITITAVRSSHLALQTPEDKELSHMHISLTKLVLYAKPGNTAEGLAHLAWSLGINQSVSSYTLKARISQQCKCSWGLNGYKTPCLLHKAAARSPKSNGRPSHAQLNTTALMLQPSKESKYFSPLTSLLSRTSNLSLFYQLGCFLQGFCTTAIVRAALRFSSIHL